VNYTCDARSLSPRDCYGEGISVFGCSLVIVVEGNEFLGGAYFGQILLLPV